MPAHLQSPQTLEERAATLLAQERELSRERRRIYLQSIGLCFFWVAAGLAFMWWAFYTGDEDTGRIALLGGILVTDVGVLTTLLRAYIRAESEGWL